MTERPEQTAGPASLVGVFVGLMLAGTPVVTDVLWPPSVWFLFCAVPPAVGLTLLLARGVVRRFGLGLLVSALALPVFVISWPFAAILIG